MENNQIKSIRTAQRYTNFPTITSSELLEFCLLAKNQGSESPSKICIGCLCVLCSKIQKRSVDWEPYTSIEKLRVWSVHDHIVYSYTTDIYLQTFPLDKCCNFFMNDIIRILFQNLENFHVTIPTQIMNLKKNLYILVISFQIISAYVHSIRS